MSKRIFVAASVLMIISAGTSVFAAFSSQHCQNNTGCSALAGDGQCHQIGNDPFGGAQSFSGGQGHMIQTCQNDVLTLQNHICTMGGLSTQVCTTGSRTYASANCNPTTLTSTTSTDAPGCND